MLPRRSVSREGLIESGFYILIKLFLHVSKLLGQIIIKLVVEAAYFLVKWFFDGIFLYGHGYFFLFDQPSVGCVSKDN